MWTACGSPLSWRHLSCAAARDRGIELRSDVYAEAATYTSAVKRLQIYIDEELDDVLAAEAARTGSSKAALIRTLVAERLGRRGRSLDPLDDLVGRYDEDPGTIDAVVYGP